MLFLIFINDTGRVINKSEYALYTDDTVFYSELNHDEDDDLVLRSHSQDDLNNIYH